MDFSTIKVRLYYSNISLNRKNRTKVNIRLMMSYLVISSLFGIIVRAITWLALKSTSLQSIWKNLLKEQSKSSEHKWEFNKYQPLLNQLVVKCVNLMLCLEKPKDGKKKKEAGGVDEKSDVEEEEESNQVTVDQKLEFVEKVKKLTNDGLTKMV